MPSRRAPFLLSLAVVLAATLHPSDEEGASGWDGCILCGGRGLADALLNVALFAPLGASLAAMGVPARAGVPLAALLSAAIEGAQLLVPGRDPSPPDLLWNAAGAVAGYLAARRARALLLPGRAAAARRSLGWSLLLALAVALTGALTAPSPGRAPLYGQWTPYIGDLAPFDGRVLSARAGAAAVPPHRLAASGPPRRALAGGETVRVELIVGHLPPSLSPVLRIADEEEEEIALLAADGEDLVSGYRMRAQDARLDRPLFRAEHALRGVSPGDTVRIAVTRSGRRIEFAVDGRHLAPAAVGPGRGWSLLFFSTGMKNGVQAALDAVWLMLGTLPLGLWLRRRPESGIAIGIAAAAMTALPAALGMPAAALPEAAGALAGLAVGAALRKALEKRLRPARTHGEEAGLSRRISSCLSEAS